MRVCFIILFLAIGIFFGCSKPEEQFIKAIEKNNWPKTEKLLIEGVDPVTVEENSEDVDNRTPLLAAADNSYFYQIEVLVEAGVTLDASDEDGKNFVDFLRRNVREYSDEISPFEKYIPNRELTRVRRQTHSGILIKHNQLRLQ